MKNLLSHLLDRHHRISIGVYFVAIAMAIAIAGCNPNDAASPTPSPAETAPTETIEPSATADITAEYVPTVAEICAAFRDYDHENPWEDQYTEPCIGWVTIDGTDYYYRHTYPSEEWTPEEVAEYFREYSYYWSGDPTVRYNEVKTYYLWTPDYSQKFVADTVSNWLLIDGVKAAPLDDTTYSMDPKDLIEAYQAMEWDGITPRRSDDFSTEVIVNQEYGLLEYRFDTDIYSEEEDPNGVAYTGYVDAEPWWKDKPNDYNVVVTNDSAHTNSSSSLAEPFYSSYPSGTRSDAWAIAYVDVPRDQQETLLAIQNPTTFMGDYLSHAMYTRRSSDGLYGLTATGARLWRAGVLRQTWKFQVSDDAHILDLKDNHLIIYTNGCILELFDDGTFDVVLDNIVSINMNNFYTPGYSPAPCFTLENGVLSFNSVNSPYTSDRTPAYKGSVCHAETTHIADDVVAADVSNWRLVLYTDASGKTYAIHDFLGGDAGVLAIHHETYEVACLGEGSIADFKAAYDDYASEHGTYSEDEFILETANAYAATLSNHE